MFKKIVLSMFALMLCLSSTVEAKKYRYQLSVCAIFNDEADYLKEWIEFHRIVGVDHFYLYNNNSVDHYLEVLEPYIKDGIVELIDWPSPTERDWTPWQKAANNHCLKKARKETKWLTIIDLDEYLFPVEQRTIPEFLKDYEKYAGVKVYWQNYGTSHISSIPQDSLMTETLTLKYPTTNNVNMPGKTIFRPKKAKRAWIHDMEYKKGYYAVTENKEKFEQQPVTVQKIRINHYWTRAEDFFFQIKIPRVEKYTKKPITPEKIQQILFESNQVEDKSIFKYIEELRQRV